MKQGKQVENIFEEPFVSNIMLYEIKRYMQQMVIN